MSDPGRSSKFWRFCLAGQTEHFTAEEWSTLLMGEALLFGLLGRMLYANPSREWIEPLVGDGLFEGVPFAETQDDVIHGLALLAEWSAAASDGLTEAGLADLRADFTRLFAGSGTMPAPPWESVYFSEERLLFQEETTDVRQWFARLGLHVNSGSKEPDDHIAFELSFVAHCAEQALQAAEEGDTGAFARLLAAQREFLEQHLLRWGPKWAELIDEHARTDFYRGLALLTRGALKEMALIFGLDIPHDLRYPGLAASR